MSPLWTPNGWVPLGEAVLGGSAVTVGPVTWEGTYSRLMIAYRITGHNAAEIGRLLLGSAAISTTALTNGNRLREGIAAENVTSVSKPGTPLAITASNIARGGWAFVNGPSGSFKEIDIIGHNGNPSVSVAPTHFRADSFFSDLGTNLPIQRAQLTVYATLITTAASANTFNAGTSIAVWGAQ